MFTNSNIFDELTIATNSSLLEEPAIKNKTVDKTNIITTAFINPKNPPANLLVCLTTGIFLTTLSNKRITYVKSIETTTKRATIVIASVIVRKTLSPILVIKVSINDSLLSGAEFITFEIASLTLNPNFEARRTAPSGSSATRALTLSEIEPKSVPDSFKPSYLPT